MYDTADLRILAVKLDVCGSIGGGIVFALYLVSVKIDHDHIVRSHSLIADTRGLYYKETAFTVDTRYIAPGKCNKSVLNKLQIVFKNLLLKLF
jgi:hypothetical protein